MKSFFSFVVSMMIRAVSVGGGSDKQSAIDAFHQTSASFNKVASVIHANPGAYPMELITSMIETANLLNAHKNLLSGNNRNTRLTRAKLREMIAWYGTVDARIAEAKVKFGL